MNAGAQASASKERAARAGAIVLAVLLALLLNVFLLKGILGLNRAASQRAPELVARARVQLVELPSDREPEPLEEEVVEPEAPPLMQIDLEAPPVELEPLELQELSFDLQLTPSLLGTSGVAVRSAIALHQGEGPRGDVSANRGPLSADAVDEPPRELASSPKPDYPRMALRRKVEGVVTIELLIDTDGRVREARNAKGDPVLVQAVTAVARQLRFSPARHQGRAVAVWGRKSFRFVLPGNRP